MVSDELRRAGQRFVSARYIAQRFAVSYQTAHHLLTELERDGFIIRRAGSGSFIAGRKNTLRSALLIFARRAKRSGSFGNLLLRQLVAKMETMELPFEVTFGPIAPKHVREDVYPVLWESPRLMHDLSSDYRFALVLHDKPPAGIGSLFTDSISVDDFGGGITAGQLLSRYSTRRPAVIGGPASDPRSQSRIDGFRRIFPSAQVIEAGTWFFRSAVQNIAAPLSCLRADALFCCASCYRIRQRARGRNSRFIDNWNSVGGSSALCIRSDQETFRRTNRSRQRHRVASGAGDKKQPALRE